MGGETWHGDFPAKGSYSPDYFIGNPAYLSNGYGTELVKKLIALVFRNTDANRILVCPEQDNRRSRNTLLSAEYLYDADNDIFYYERP